MTRPEPIGLLSSIFRIQNPDTLPPVPKPAKGRLLDSEEFNGVTAVYTTNDLGTVEDIVAFEIDNKEVEPGEVERRGFIVPTVGMIRERIEGRAL